LTKGDIARMHENTQFGKGEVVGVSHGTILKSDGGFLWAGHCDHCTTCTSKHSVAICCRMSPTLKSTWGGSLGGKI